MNGLYTQMKFYFCLGCALLIVSFQNRVMAQCLSGNCYAFATISSTQICRGQSITLESEGGSAALFNNFNGQIIGSGWQTNNINVLFTNPCGPNGVDGTPYLWFGNTSGAGQRNLTTVDFNLTGGGNVSFDLRFSIQGQASPCEGPDENDEGVYFQYSTNAGATWTTIFYFDPDINNVSGGAASPYATWAAYSYPIPAAAQTPCTRFRWNQEVVSGATFDHWGLDNIFIGGPPPNPGSVVFQWLDGVPAGPNRIETPTSSTNYVLMYGNSADTCYDTVSVTVFDVPVASISATPLQACLGAPIQFNASGSSSLTPINNYKWIFNNSGVVNQTTTVPTTSFQYPVVGNFNAGVIVTSGICSDTAFVPVSVTNPPSISFTFPTPVCTDALFILNASATTVAAPLTISTYSWDIGNDGTVDITSNLPTAQASISQPGTTPIKLTVTSSAGCSASATQNMVVYDVPNADFSFNDACIGATTQFANTSTGTATQWSWNFDGLQTSLQQSPGFIFPGAGNYTVTLIANNGNVCYDTVSYTFEIKNTVNADFSFNAPCTLTGIFQDNSSVPPSSEGVINSWNWSFGNGNTATAQNPTHVYGGNGIYPVTLITGTDRGCLDTVTFQVPRYAVPIAAFSAAPVCFGDVTQFANTSSVSSGNVVTNLWSFGDGSESDQFSPSYSYDADGFFDVTLIVITENGCADTIETSYQVYPQPVANYSADPEGFTDMLSPEVQFTDLSTNTDNWFWTFGTSGSSTDQNPLFSFPSSGSYDVTLVAGNQYGCKATYTQSYEVLPAYNFYVPSAFTPDDEDDFNPVFRVYHTGLKELFFTLYNRWGEEIFTTRDPDFIWDGTFRGKKASEGIYSYRAWVRDLEGKQYDYTGQVLLMY
jgi:PKD repeat protein